MARAQRSQLQNSGASAVFRVVSAVAHCGVAPERRRNGSRRNCRCDLAGRGRAFFAGASRCRSPAGSLLQHLRGARRFGDHIADADDRAGHVLAARGGQDFRPRARLGFHDARDRLPRRGARRKRISRPRGGARGSTRTRARPRRGSRSGERSILRADSARARGTSTHQRTQTRAGISLFRRAAAGNRFVQRPRAFFRRSVRDLVARRDAGLDGVRGVRTRALAARRSCHLRSRPAALATQFDDTRANRKSREHYMITIDGRTRTSLYVRCATAADRGAWSVERDIAWAEIDRERAFARPEVLASLRDAALIESYHPVNLARLLRATLDDIDAGVVFSLELYEGFKHFHSLRRYLDAIGYEPAITDDELVTIRQAQVEVDIGPGDLIPRLVEFMLSEHLAHYFFRRLGEQAEDRVLADLLSRIAADEVRHAQSASDLIAKRIVADSSVIQLIMDRSEVRR